MSSSGGNRRKYQRTGLNLVVQHRVDSLEAFTQDRTLNVSPGGMFMRTDKPRPVGSQVYFQVLMHDGTKLLEGLARVVRVVEANEAGVPAGMALEFINLDDESRELLHDIIGKH
ncbi:MAG: TIGR02266 family protein [Myxococcota bacterium]